MPFSLKTGGPGGNFTIRATNSRGFDSTSPSSLYLESGKTVNGTVTISTARTTPSGTDVTLTIEAEAPGAEDTNYVVLRFTIINTVRLQSNKYRLVIVFKLSKIRPGTPEPNLPDEFILLPCRSLTSHCPCVSRPACSPTVRPTAPRRPRVPPTAPRLRGTSPSG